MNYAELFGLDWQVLMTIFNTLIMYAVLKHFLYKPVKAMFAQRKEEVEKIYSDANEAKDSAMEMKSDYEHKMASAKKEAHTIVQTATKKANENSQQIVATAQTKANTILKKAQTEIDREKAQVKNELKNEISSIAILAAERVINKELKQEDHEELIEKFIQTVGDTEWKA